MKVLFLTIGRMPDIEAHALYPDLLRQFRDHGHDVYIVSPRERRTGLPTELVQSNGVSLLYVRIGNITKCRTVEKGVSTILIEGQFKKAIKCYFRDVKFDLVMYSTPPITLAGVIEFVKKRDNAKSYLLLKDIFPQNAVDLGMISKTGVKGMLYKFFRNKERKLYALSDYIGCMSHANVEYVLRNNLEVDSLKVEVCPNAIEPVDMSVSPDEKVVMRDKYAIPHDKIVFVYGGNLGKPQGIPFLIECLKSQKDNDKAFFLIVGDGTEYGKLEQFLNESKQINVKLMNRLPKEDYDRMVGSCDVGMIFLDHRFTIPNFPSRLLSYMQAKLPVLAVTDPNTDIGKVITEGDFGWWCESNDNKMYAKTIENILSDIQNEQRGLAGYKYLIEHYSAERCYAVIVNHFNKI